MALMQHITIGPTSHTQWPVDTTHTHTGCASSGRVNLGNRILDDQSIQWRVEIDIDRDREEKKERGKSLTIRQRQVGQQVTSMRIISEGQKRPRANKTSFVSDSKHRSDIIELNQIN